MTNRKKSLRTYLKDNLARSAALADELKGGNVDIANAKAQIHNASQINRNASVLISGYKTTGEKFSMKEGL